MVERRSVCGYYARRIRDLLRIEGAEDRVGRFATLDDVVDHFQRGARKVNCKSGAQQKRELFTSASVVPRPESGQAKKDTTLATKPPPTLAFKHGNCKLFYQIAMNQNLFTYETYRRTRIGHFWPCD